MTKCNKILIKLALLVSLFIACGLTGETKIRLESSVKDITDEIDEIKKEGASQGIKYENFKEKATGSKVAESTFIYNSKLRAVKVAEAFFTAIEEEANKLKESGGSSQFLAMFDLMLKVSKPLEDVGIQNMEKNTLMGTEKNPANTAERVIEIAKNLKKKLQEVKRKNENALKNHEEKQNKANSSSTST
ncbi:decorin-binding protein DbpA (plasmid) [Borreliella yangtzensis]|uniref:Decorin binding protein A n=1 Tax=Borreliella yangtzensis TaxID=683292 RepID=A0ABR6PAF6_9SPIR|nr:decorin-binding protein DbpA [Borreliella yangtzensis]MBB6043257.1 hypothetical protein [Borreliella yangtzensis]WKC72966.1 decorin-binding protein DbpA [Borreliella yangtzensis]WKC73885.1 decorin-binding protein DbpA [Borreliella yangtzensis]